MAGECVVVIVKSTGGFPQPRTNECSRRYLLAVVTGRHRRGLPGSIDAKERGWPRENRTVRHARWQTLARLPGSLALPESGKAIPLEIGGLLRVR